MKKTRITEDYRVFLKNEFEKKKLISPRLSYQSLANKVGVTKSYFKMVFDKKRHLNTDLFFILAEYFKLSDYDKQFILFQILEAGAAHKTSKAFFRSILQNFEARSNISTTDKLKSDTTQDISHWLFSTIHTLCSLENFDPSPEWIQSKLGGKKVVSLKKIKWAFNRLVKDDMIVQVDGKWAPRKINNFSDGKVWSDEDYKVYQTGLSRTQIAIDTISDNNISAPCRYHMYTMLLSNENADKLSILYDEFESKIRELMNEEQNGERIMFLSNNLFPASVNNVHEG